MRIKAIGSALLLSGLLAAYASEPPEKVSDEAEITETSPAASAASSASAERHEQGRDIYNFRCYYCHGYSGDARTLASSYLSPKPRDFTSADPESLTRESMLQSVLEGRPGTAMVSFSRILNREEAEIAVDFIRQEFMISKAPNTYYHIPENGWPNHDRYADAFPFATGELALDTPWEQLNPAQLRGKRLFITTCITCHDRANVMDEGPVWEPRSLSYPRNNFSYTDVDASSGASVYAMHDIAPNAENLNEQERLGETLYQQNCAFCHAADGTGRNWIGSFMIPRPRDLTNKAFMAGMNKDRFRTVIRDGLPGTSMPAWKNVLSEEQIQAIISYVLKVFGTQ